MDACRREIGVQAAEIVAGKRPGGGGKIVELTPVLQPGETIRRR
jgi:LacI family gluconate utilization system Gnt-I transcriptional repressor